MTLRNVNIGIFRIIKISSHFIFGDSNKINCRIQSFMLLRAITVFNYAVLCV
jgi:hypothetical protein